MKTRLIPSQKKQLTYRVEDVLGKLCLHSTVPVTNIIEDSTRDSFSSIVFNGQSRKYFIKIKLLDTAAEKEKFRKVAQIHTVLKKHQPPLYHLTPRLIDQSVDGNNADFLLFEYMEGKNLGSRTEHDVFDVNFTALSEIVTVNKAIQTFPVGELSADFKQGDANFFWSLLYEDGGFDKNQLQRFFTDSELSRIENLRTDKTVRETINTPTYIFVHGDFQPPNLLRTQRGIMVVDFDSSMLTNRFYDWAYLYNHAYRKPEIQKSLLPIFLDSPLTTEDEQLLTFVRFCLTFVWVKVFINKKDWYKENKVADLRIRESIFRKRLADSRELLKRL